MAKHRTIVCKSWLDFKGIPATELFAGKPFHRGVYLFRGHGSASWPLMSSFDRWFAGVGGSRTDKIKASTRLLSLFEEEAIGVKEALPPGSEEVVRLSLAQHHGVPTRLLDWTESPYVAAFFAFAGIALTPKPEPNVAIWCLDARSPIWSKELGVEILSVSAHGNERLKNQLGRFTLLRAPYDTLEEYVSNFGEAEEALAQYVLPSSEARVALADLDVMGINYSNIFPGLEGCARAAKLRVLFERPGGL